MAAPSPTIESILRGKLGELQAYSLREPTHTLAVAFGVGLLINLLPARVVTGALTAVGSLVVRPALLSLGITKALELYCQQPSIPKNNAHVI